MALTITAIVCAYNEARYLPACLYSLLAQTRPPDEIIVVNNASSDQTGAVARAVPGTPLRNETIGFPGQVVLVHGDSHYFKVDKPLNGPSGGVLANFTRVETFGARNTHWVRGRIDAADPNVFVFEPRIVAANAH